MMFIERVLGVLDLSALNDYAPLEHWSLLAVYLPA